ncbi:hypothetical protein Taro_017941 [Colocasia esculenta]|uniref:Uncharacterized protein n=1 Tax=Colocasia esculenta TaxID=4460 RepID=A0A843UQ21_COLES|nr:hypothetical protein [Colocasia esculenta]
MGSYSYPSSASIGERSGSPAFSMDEETPRKEPSQDWRTWAEELLEEEEKVAEEEHDESGSLEEAWMWKGKRKGSSGGVMLEGYVDGWEQGSDGGAEGGGVGRTKSLTDDDLEELKGCLDLGFGFCYEDIPELCNTLPALELCYSMSQRFHDEQQQQQSRSPESPGVASEHSHSSSSPIANWKISSPGDHPEEVKARLKYWAQAVACTVRLCS